MGVIADVFFAVAVVAVAAGAVAEFQLRIGHIGSAADGAAVGVGGLHRGGAGSIRAGSGEGDHLGLARGLLRGIFFLLAYLLLYIIYPFFAIPEKREC